MEFKNQYLETKNTKYPSNILIFNTLSTILTVAALKCLRRKNPALLIGQLAVPILLFSIYNSIAKKEDNSIQEITTLWTE